MEEYSLDVQKLFLEMMMGDAQSFVRLQSIYNPENFERQLQPAAEFILTHADEHKTLPTFEQLNVMTSQKFQPVEKMNEGHTEWLMVEFEQFTKSRELERAIVESADLLEKKEFGAIEAIIKKAVQISLNKGLGTNYFEDPRMRLERLRASNGQISTGFRELDKVLFGGFNRGELNIFAGASGSGKSLVLQNMSLNWIMAGLNGVYITLELSEDLSSMRLDAMVSNIRTRDIFRELDTVEMKVKMVEKKAGSFYLKYMPAQSNVNDLRAYIKELQIQTDIKLDFIAVDYMDLLMPVDKRVGPADAFLKDKFVSEDLRNLSAELDVLTISASQLNRGAVEEIDFNHSHIAGGISKIYTCDNLIGLFTSRSMRERGRFRMQMMKTRNSDGVDKSFNLELDINTLRIRDLPEDESEASASVSPAAMTGGAALNALKHPNTATKQPAPSIEASKDKLQNMINNLGN
tara:strand:+ start:2299 stop:3684 length:1386 start_codon:yes stop_codon:yes gene_type:complete